jgi:hypothetical protein
MAEFKDISDWNILEWVTTTGTREKFFVENPANGKLYFFKESIDKYPDEYWSEIIASKVGQKLGFNVLDYNIAMHDDIFGCICESMIDQSMQELEHGINLIKKSIPGFKLSARPIINFQDVEIALGKYNPYFINKFIEVMVFDALIGNRDRHSENWAIIRSLDMTNKPANLSRVTRLIYTSYKNSGLKFRNIPFKKYFLSVMNESQLIDYKFSPIYDSGSSLGRELDEARMTEALQNEEEVQKYIRKGKSEILWNSKKMNHFDLLKEINEKYNQHLTKCVIQVTQNWNDQEISKLIYEIDAKIPERHFENKLSLQRKELIYTMIKHRFTLLGEVLQ